jgi:hypothetical protein
MRSRVTENRFDRHDGVAVLDDVAELESRLTAGELQPDGGASVRS